MITETVQFRIQAWGGGGVKSYVGATWSLKHDASESLERSGRHVVFEGGTHDLFLSLKKSTENPK